MLSIDAKSNDSYRMSGLWGYQTALDLYLQENGITTLLFAGVNADQVKRLLLCGIKSHPLFKCVLGTVIDSYYRGYDVILVEDGTATSSPTGGLENVLYNVGGVRTISVFEKSMLMYSYLRVMDSSLTASALLQQSKSGLNEISPRSVLNLCCTSLIYTMSSSCHITARSVSYQVIQLLCYV